MLPLAEIEQGIKDAVAALQRPYIAEIKTYAGEFDFDDEREFALVVRRFPAVWTTFDGSGKPTRLSARKYKVPLVFSVIVGARSIRTEETARHGVKVGNDLVSVGSFVLLKDVLLACNGQRFGLDAITPLEMGIIRTIFNTRTQAEAVSVLAQSFTTDCTVTVPDGADATAPWLERVNVDYVLQPSDEAADAADFIALNGD